MASPCPLIAQTGDASAKIHETETRAILQRAGVARIARAKLLNTTLLRLITKSEVTRDSSDRDR